MQRRRPAGARALGPHALDVPRLHRWLAAAMAGLAVGFLVRTARIDTAQTAARLESLQRELGRTYEALVAAERASSAVFPMTAMAPPATVARAPSRRSDVEGRTASSRRDAGSTARRPARRRKSPPSDARENTTVGTTAGRTTAPRRAEAPAEAAAPPAVVADTARQPATPDTLPDAETAPGTALGEGDVLAFLQQFRRTFERMNADEVARLFGEGAVDDGRVGLGAIAEHYAERFDGLEATRFVVSHPEIRIDGDRAEVAGAYSATFVDVAGRSWAVDGMARWSIVRTGDSMKIVRFERTESSPE